MSEFLYVADTVTTAVREAVKPFGVELTKAEYIGSHSAYKFTFTKGSKTSTLQFAYDFKVNAVLVEITRIFNVSIPDESETKDEPPVVAEKTPAPEKKRGKK